VVTGGYADWLYTALKSSLVLLPFGLQQPTLILDEQWTDKALFKAIGLV
jgi:hypothetical protein